MRQLLPTSTDVDPFDAHATALRPVPGDRPWVMLNVVTSVDGTTTVDGRSGPLGTPADKLVFSALRSAADVVMAGARTIVAETYRPPRTSEEHQRERVARGQRAKPRMAFVSASLSVPVDAEIFSDPAERPIVVTSADVDPGRLAAMEDVADVIAVGRGGVDLTQAFQSLRSYGEIVLCEGGSTLNGHLIGADLVDEVNLSVAAAVAAGHGPRLAAGPLEVLRPLSLAHLWEEDGMLLARYVTDRGQ